MTKLTYPKLPKVRLGLWTFKVKVHYYTGIVFEEIHVWCNNEEMHVDFQVDLTQEQIDWINALVQRSDVQGPDSGLVVVDNTYVLYDIWERRDLISAASGVDFRLWWDSSGDFGPNVMDKILFTPIGPGGSVKILTNQEKRALVDAIGAGNGWE
jgi:hypothetical protein